MAARGNPQSHTALLAGKQLKELRIASNMSQTEVASKVGVSQVTISNWETGRSTPDAAESKRLAAFLGPAPSGNSPVPAGDTTGLFGNWLRNARAHANLTPVELAELSGVSAVQIYNLEAGRSANPRDATRRALEKALKTNVPADVQKDVADEQAIEGLGPLTDFDPHDKNDRPACSGVYVFYDISDRPVYVGQSQDIKKRVGSHEEKFWFKFPIVSHAAYIEVTDKNLRRQVEQVLIKFLKSNAVINKQSVDSE